MKKIFIIFCLLFIAIFVFSTTIVNDVISWQNCIERVEANIYKIKNDIKSLKIEVGEYYISDILSQGDTYAVLKTNNCQNFICESGTIINVGDTASYLDVNTIHSVIENVYIKGTGTVAASVSQSFLQSSDYVRFNNCKTSNRYSNVNFFAFKGNIQTRYTIEYNNCMVVDCKTTSTTCGAFWTCAYINHAYVNNLTTDSGYVVVYYECYNLIACKTFNCTGVLGTYVYYTVYDANNCGVWNISASNGNCYVGYNVFRFSNCSASNISAVGGNCIGYTIGDGFSNCYVDQMYSYGLYGTYGFMTLELLTTCLVTNAITYGKEVIAFYNIEEITTCDAYLIYHLGTGNVYGYYGCEQVVANKCESFFVTNGYKLYYTNCLNSNYNKIRD